MSYAVDLINKAIETAETSRKLISESMASIELRGQLLPLNEDAKFQNHVFTSKGEAESHLTTLEKAIQNVEISCVFVNSRMKKHYQDLILFTDDGDGNSGRMIGKASSEYSVNSAPSGDAAEVAIDIMSIIQNSYTMPPLMDAPSDKLSLAYNIFSQPEPDRLKVFAAMHPAAASGWTTSEAESASDTPSGLPNGPEAIDPFESLRSQLADVTATIVGATANILDFGDQLKKTSSTATPYVGAASTTIDVAIDVAGSSTPLEAVGNVSIGLVKGMASAAVGAFVAAESMNAPLGVAAAITTNQALEESFAAVVHIGSVTYEKAIEESAKIYSSISKSIYTLYGVAY